MKTMFKKALVLLCAGFLTFGFMNAMAKTSAAGQQAAGTTTTASCKNGKKCEMAKKKMQMKKKKAQMQMKKKQMEMKKKDMSEPSSDANQNSDANQE